jgi:PKD repeat protein
VSLNVGASGSSLSYQWQKGGTNISGANSSTYTLPNALPSNSGNYTVVVSNTCLSTTSNIAILTVNATTAIGSQPSSVAVCPGANTSFSVTASGTGPFTYKWEKNTGGAWFTVGGNSASLSIAPAANQDIAQYRVNVQGSCGEAISNNVALTLNPIPSIPTVADVARCGPGTLAATAASSSPSPTFNWYSNSGDLSPVFTGATRTISSLSVTTTQYASVVSLGCESPRKPVVFTLNPIKNVPLGNSLTLCAGQAAYNLENDIADPVAKGNNFTWSAGGTNFSSKTFDPVVVGLGTYTVSYNPPSVAQATPHCYVNTTRTVQVTTGAVSITFTDPLVSAGNTVNTCVGNAPITISSFPSVPGGTWSTVSGSGISSSGATTLFTPDASNFTATNPNVFRYSVSSGGCSGTKDLYIFVKDNQAPPIVSGLPALVCPSTNLSLSASVSITGTYTYDWFKPGQQNPFTSGASLSFPVNGNEDIFVRSVNSFNCRSSATQVSIRTPFGAGAITVNKSNVAVGEMVKFSYSVNNSGNTYEWEFGDGGRSREFSPAYYFYKPAQYSVKLKVISTIGCTQNTQFDFITVTGTPVNVVTAADDVAIPNKVSFYPNPVASELTIEAPFPVLEYSVMDMSGRAIASERPTGERTFKVDASGLEPGMYVLRIGTTDKKKFSLKFIKQ